MGVFRERALRPKCEDAIIDTGITCSLYLSTVVLISLRTIQFNCIHQNGKTVQLTWWSIVNDVYANPPS